MIATTIVSIALVSMAALSVRSKAFRVLAVVWVVFSCVRLLVLFGIIH